jgi:hypothetical protein
MDLTWMTNLKETLEYATVTLDFDILDEICSIRNVISKSLKLPFSISNIFLSLQSIIQDSAQKKILTESLDSDKIDVFAKIKQIHAQKGKAETTHRERLFTSNADCFFIILHGTPMAGYQYKYELEIVTPQEDGPATIHRVNNPYEIDELINATKIDSTKIDSDDNSLEFSIKNVLRDLAENTGKEIPRKWLRIK